MLGLQFEILEIVEEQKNMKILLKSLVLQNFKGLKNKTINFDKIETNIVAPNRGGKTTIIDAFMWLLFDKNSHGEPSKDIKTLDTENNVIENLEHSVEAVLLINDEENIIKRVHTQNWVKKRGEEERELGTPINRYFWNDLEMKTLTAYNTKIKEIIHPEMFLLLANPLKFNNLDWKEQREMLFKMCSNINNDRIFEQFTQFEPLKSIKNIEEYRLQLVSKRNNFKKKNTELDGQLKGLELAVQDLEEPKYDINEINTRINANEQIKEEINKINLEQVQARAKFILSEMKEINGLKLKIQEISGSLLLLDGKSVGATGQINVLDSNICISEEELTRLRKQVISLKKLEFDESNLICQACEQPYTAEKTQQIKLKFEETKKLDIENITIKGKATKEKLEVAKFEVLQKAVELKKLLKEIKASKEIKVSLTLKLEELEKNTAKFDEKPYLDKVQVLKEKSKDIEIYKQQLKEINQYKFSLKTNLDVVEKIKEIKILAKENAKNIAETEKLEMLVEDFTNVQTKEYEKQINLMFKITKFKLFKKQSNGDIVECCEAMLDGVNFNQLNSEAKLNVGLDIINVLSDFYATQAPIFIDNRESVQELTECSAQIINLIVPPIKFEGVVNL